jgi:hypothetical protein
VAIVYMGTRSDNALHRADAAKNAAVEWAQTALIYNDSECPNIGHPKGCSFMQSDADMIACYKVRDLFANGVFWGGLAGRSALFLTVLLFCRAHTVASCAAALLPRHAQVHRDERQPRPAGPREHARLHRRAHHSSRHRGR